MQMSTSLTISLDKSFRIGELFSNFFFFFYNSHELLEIIRIVLYRNEIFQFLV